MLELKMFILSGAVGRTELNKAISCIESYIGLL